MIDITYLSLYLFFVLTTVLVPDHCEFTYSPFRTFVQSSLSGTEKHENYFRTCTYVLELPYVPYYELDLELLMI